MLNSLFDKVVFFVNVNSAHKQSRNYCIMIPTFSWCPNDFIIWYRIEV